MFSRSLYKVLEKHLGKPQITVIVGMRRVGKSTALKHLFNSIKHTNKLYIDLEKIEWRNLFFTPSYDDIKTALELEGIDFENPCVIALDEIQLVPIITSIIKYYYDTYKIKFLVTGSSSFYLKNRFTESLAGRKRIFEMFPLNFEEYLNFRQHSNPSINKHKNKLIKEPVYRKYKDAYEDYLQYGGYPEVVLAENKEDKLSYLSDVINSYISLDILLLSDFEASHDLYRLLQLLSNRIGSKVDVSKISSRLGLDRRKVTDYIELLEYTYIIHLIRPYSKSKDVEISKARKLYFADTGLIHAFNPNCPTGAVFENKICNQLISSGHTVNYYQKKSGQEIDFILNESTAIEVKETPTLSDYKKLKRRAESLGMAEYYLVGRYWGQGFGEYRWGGVE